MGMFDADGMIEADFLEMPPVIVVSLKNRKECNVRPFYENFGGRIEYIDGQYV